ncbi:related to integral membrane protein pth11 [Phialocephala subalpina]|uniref:Related to integral membrane protein pth11 n=1 Tax=Phialocephala subalpina TaxID=576137 RepID=A0A1L7X6Q0_9HELO|nr:related to integral membrane protein pth11 [Phialocephala subalpina]
MNQLGGFGPTIIGVMWAETVIALLFICLRLLTKAKLLNRHLSWDDYLIAFSWFMLMPYTVACTSAAFYGFGRHASELTTKSFVEATRAEIIGQTFCIIGIATSKASAAVFLLRITIIQWHRWILHFLIVAVAVPCFLCALFDFIRCDPVAHVWNPTIDAKCWISTEGFTTLSITVGVSSAWADLVLAILPWFILWNLQMKRKEKILIASSMSLGFFAMICGIVRTIALEGLTARSDYSYETVGLILWSSTELMVTILTATIPCLRPLYTKLRGRSSSDDSYNKQDGNRSRSQGYQLNNIGVDKDNGRPNLDTYLGHANTAVAGGKNDDQSDKSMLECADGNIIRTDVVTVQVDYDESDWGNKSKAWSREKACEREAV